MSRIDDDHSDRRIEDARLADRKAQDRLKKDRTDQASAFDRALAQRATEQPPKAREAPAEKPKAEPKPQDARAKQAPPPQAGGQPKGPPRATAQAEAQAQMGRTAEGDRQTEAQGAGRRASQAAGEKPAHTTTKADPRAVEGKERSSSDSGAGGKAEDGAKETGASSGKKGAAVRRADDDDRGGKGRDQGSKDQQAQPFRVPLSALMAPPPLARPKDTGAGRFGAFTKEIVDKIVSRVLVGTNSQGVPEFRLELKSSVMKGLSIRVSGKRGGKIRAVFSGGDHDVMEALKSHSSELVDALSARGLTLEDLSFEDAK